MSTPKAAAVMNSALKELYIGADKDELELVGILATAYNRLDADIIKPYLADDVVYESQISFEPVTGNAAVMAHLEDKFQFARKNIITHDVWAEIGFCGGPTADIYLLGTDGKPCVLLSQSCRTEPSGLIILKTDERMIKRLDVCIVVPNPLSAIRTGEYPE